MRRVLFVLLLAIHGAIHLMGPVELWEIADLDGIAPPIASDTVIAMLGALWLLAAVGFIAGAALLWRHDRRWRPFTLAAAVLSIVIAGAVWQDAWAGMIVDVVIALVALPGRLLANPVSDVTAPHDGAIARMHVIAWRPKLRRTASRG